MARPTEPLQGGLHQPLANRDSLAAGPNWDAMTDEEIMRGFSQETERDKYAVPPHMEPDGMKYQWARCEVYGRPDQDRIAQMEQSGWRPVPQSRHDGYWMAPGTQGPVILDGMMLFELPQRVVRLKREFASRQARSAVQDMNAQLSYAPPGTGPRGTHNYTAPIARSTPGALEIQVE